MNKKGIIQAGCLFLMTVFLVALFFVGYHYGKSGSQSEIVTVGQKNASQQESTEEILAQGAEYVLESNHLDTDTMDTQTTTLPVEFIGLSKGEVIDYITSHKEQFQGKDEEIKNISMVSFSKDMLVLRKDVIENIAIREAVRKYESNQLYHYYMVLEDGYLVVYKQDKTTLFLETGICEDELDENDKDQLLQGVGVKNVSELYRCLEGYTS